jgi:hypothetical protein
MQDPAQPVNTEQRRAAAEALWSADANREGEGGCIKARYTRISTPDVGKNGSILRRLVCLTVVVTILPSSHLLTSCSLLTAHPSRNNNNLIVNHSNQSINQSAY